MSFSSYFIFLVVIMKWIIKVTKAYVLFGQTPPSPVLFHTLLLDPSPPPGCVRTLWMAPNRKAFYLWVHKNQPHSNAADCATGKSDTCNCTKLQVQSFIVGVSETQKCLSQSVSNWHHRHSRCKSAARKNKARRVIKFCSRWIFAEFCSGSLPGGHSWWGWTLASNLWH